MNSAKTPLIYAGAILLSLVVVLAILLWPTPETPANPLSSNLPTSPPASSADPSREVDITDKATPLPSRSVAPTVKPTPFPTSNVDREDLTSEQIPPLIELNFERKIAPGTLFTWCYKEICQDWSDAELDLLIMEQGTGKLVISHPEGSFSNWEIVGFNFEEAPEIPIPLLSKSESNTGSRQALEIEGPPQGLWLLSAEVTFTDGTGFATYHWLLEVLPAGNNLETPSDPSASMPEPTPEES